MSTETIAAELKIRLNCRMKCNEFFKFVQTEPDLIKYARRTEKYSFTKKCCSTWLDIYIHECKILFFIIIYISICDFEIWFIYESALWNKMKINWISLWRGDMLRWFFWGKNSVIFAIRSIKLFVYKKSYVPHLCTTFWKTVYLKCTPFELLKTPFEILELAALLEWYKYDKL